MAAWQQTACLLVAIAAIIFDTQQRKIPNSVVAIGLVTGAILAVMVTSPGIRESIPYVVGFLLGLVCFLPLYAMRMMGAGDVKLFAIFGLLLGWKALLPIWLVSCLTLTLHTALISSKECISPGHSRTIQDSRYASFKARVGESIKNKNGMPYGAHLGISAIFHICTGGAYAIV